ncbi:MAG TPA: B12-binding domain-containing radical SAM protein [Vicinamibacterales bacterium]|jgi:radical SAM superfamily enzyme YgiQ (UPF0313 family)
MKILLLNPRCPQTYWTFDRVLRMTGRKATEAPLSLITVAAILPQTWDYTLVDLAIRTVSAEEWAAADVVMISGMAVQSTGMLTAVAEAKTRGKLVVVGGPLAFHAPEEFLRAGADIVVKGELEPVAADLVAAIERRDSGVVLQTVGRADMCTSPVPRFDLLQFDDYLDVGVQFSRGCPFRCEFCDVTTMFGHDFRTKPPAHILEELQVLYDMGWRRHVFFVDDNLIGLPGRAKDLLRALIPWMEQRGYPFDFTTQVSVNLARDEELLDLMVRAGFTRVFVGIESTDIESLKMSGKHQNVMIDLDHACDVITRAGLQIIAGCIVGFDHEKAGADDRLIDFAIRNQIPEMFVTQLQVGPGTDLWKRLEKEGRLLPMAFSDDIGSQTGAVNFVPTRPPEEIAREFVRIYDVLYEPRAFIERTYHHFAKMRPRPIKKGFFMPTVGEVRAVAIAGFRQLVLSPCRWTFLKMFVKAVVTFPGRLPYYLTSCVTAEHYFEYRRTIRRQQNAVVGRHGEAAPD